MFPLHNARPARGHYDTIFFQGPYFNAALPEILSTTGKAGKSVTASPEAVQDEFFSDSWRWQFRELHGMVRGDEIGTKYNERQPMVRTAFDTLEKKFAVEAWKAEQKAVALKKAGKAAAVLDEFMAKCVEERLAAVEALKAKMASCLE